MGGRGGHRVVIMGVASEASPKTLGFCLARSQTTGPGGAATCCEDALRSVHGGRNRGLLATVGTDVPVMGARPLEVKLSAQASHFSPLAP